MASPDEPDDFVLPLRDRVPEYAAVFAVGLGASAGVGLAFGFLIGEGIWNATGYTIAIYGIVMLLAGGATGGGYTNLGAGALGAAFGGRRLDEEEQEHQERRMGRMQDPMDRLRKGLRPEANPRAFWQVIAGIFYIAIGIGIASRWG